MPDTSTELRVENAANSRRVLVVDDNADSAELIGMILERAGHQAKIVSNALDAPGLALSFLPHVALIDIQMPEMNGYELAKELRSRPELKHCRLIAVSGQPGEKAIARSVAAGFEAVWAKPISAEDVLALVQGRGQSSRVAR